MKKVTKETPHEKDTCTREMRWYLLRLLDERDELKRIIQISLIREHINHLED